MNGREAQDCLREIAAARDRLGHTVLALRRRTAFNPLDWRAWVRRYPVEATLSAAAFGFVLAAPGPRTLSVAGFVLHNLSDSGIRILLRSLIP